MAAGESIGWFLKGKILKLTYISVGIKRKFMRFDVNFSQRGQVISTVHRGLVIIQMGMTLKFTHGEVNLWKPWETMPLRSELLSPNMAILK
jgi:hypothetical protein